MPTRNVVLTQRQAEFVEALVASGRYQNASEVLRDGPRVLERQNAEDEARLAVLREAARIGQEDIDAGRHRLFATGDALRRHLSDLTARTLADAAEVDGRDRR